MKKLILSILTIAMVFSLAACGNSYKAKKLAKKTCECEKLRKKARKSDSEKKQREADKCSYELEAMQADFLLSNFDEYWKSRKKDKESEEMEELEDIYQEVYDECKDNDDDDD